MQKKIDVRGITQEQAVTLIEQTLENQSIATLEILSSEQENTTTLMNYLGQQGITVSEVLQNEEGQTIIANLARDQKMQLKSYVVGTEILGQGDEVIGRKLMNAFFNVSADYEQVPASIFFMNTGVKLCIENADALVALKKLQEKGTDIIVCGTCLDFFEIKDQLAVGRTGTMHDLIGIYHNQQVITL